MTSLLMVESISTAMWFQKRTKRAEAIKGEAFDKIDMVIKSVDRNTEQLEALNKALEAKGDTAYNIFRATPAGSRRKK